MRKILLFPLLFFLSCDKVVSTHPVGGPFTREAESSCNYLGVCETCMPGFDGKAECSFKASAFCPGSQTVLQKVQVEEEIHQSARRTRWEEVEVVKELTECKGD